MATEVFAEDIEELLERLEGVASARVVANDAGEIETVYLTAAGELDEVTLRRTVAAALMARYSLAVDGWRIRVARLRGEVPHARWRLHRVEEVLTTSGAHVTVELQGEGVGGPTLTGRARGLPDRANRMRTVVLATLDALKSMLEAEERRATLETISAVPLIGKEAVVVALSIGSPEGSSTCVSAAVNEGAEADALIAATLDAVAKRETKPRARGWMMKDRRDQLESMRAHYRRLREPQRKMPALSPAEGTAGTSAESTRNELILRTVPGGKLIEEPTPRPAEEAGLAPVEPLLDEAAGGEQETAFDESKDSRIITDDTVAGMEQIRPERPGGAAVAAVGHRFEAERNRAAEQAQGKPPGKGAMEDDFFRHLVVTGIPVHIRCRDGYEIPEAVLKDFGTYTLLVETDGGRELIFKHGIISLRPLKAAVG